MHSWTWPNRERHRIEPTQSLPIRRCRRQRRTSFGHRQSDGRCLFSVGFERCFDQHFELGIDRAAWVVSPLEVRLQCAVPEQPAHPWRPTERANASFALATRSFRWLLLSENRLARGARYDGLRVLGGASAWRGHGSEPTSMTYRHQCRSVPHHIKIHYVWDATGGQRATYASDIFAKIATSRRNADAAQGRLEVLSWSWGVNQTGTIGIDGGGGAGRAAFSDFNFHPSDRQASPLLLKACADGQHIKEAFITVRKAGKGQQEFLSSR